MNPLMICTRLIGAGLLSAGFMLSGCVTASKHDYAKVKAEIREGERQWAESVATGDVSALEMILADDFVGVDPHGNFYDKKKMIADTKDGPKYFLSNRLNSVRVRFFSDAAVAQG